jgi:molecular chaperone GrpE
MISDPELTQEATPESVIDEKAVSAPEAEAASDAAEAPTDPITALEAEVTKWKELALRTAADLDNYRKRAAREREESVRYANQGLLEDLLPVVDNFEMGMMAAAQDQSSMIYIGMDMVRRQLQEFLTNSGLKEVEALGKEFDPNLHDAVAQEVSAEVPEGQIIRVSRRGFTLRDRLLRPASVVVAKAADVSEESPTA